ncbi:hypothetical protein [Agromyces indicus]|uniref:Uncharacterized protein n=1 Tax=Agromyces indicus TaxID=758919 RepID=A0ABU1FL15_9MICO|nr:hypothetical protein [Agromyces indicus]MDR5692096.1 hypothetical protein [Agromyces indicus]
MADAPGPDPSPPASGAGPDGGGLTDAQKSLRAQMLATEHWSLLASRSTTQSEVLTRIAIFLTLVSAGLLALGLLGNATKFRGWFGVAAIGILLLLAVLGYITQLRAFNTATDDLMYVMAMNRLRGAYLDLDPGLEPYLVSSPNDDQAGAERTYYAYGARRSQIFASSMMIITVVEAAVLGLLGGAVTIALGATIIAAVVIGLVIAMLAVVGWLMWGYRMYRRMLDRHVPLRRTSED